MTGMPVKLHATCYIIEKQQCFSHDILSCSSLTSLQLP